MNPQLCEREAAVLKAQRTGFWPEGLQQHAANCEACSDALLVAGFLAAEADEIARRAEATLPPAAQVWWRAERRLRRETARKATLPITLVERASLLAGGVGAVGVLGWAWPTIVEWFNLFRFTAPAEGWSLSFSSLSIVVGGAALFLFALLFGVYAVWADQ